MHYIYMYDSYIYIHIVNVPTHAHFVHVKSLYIDKVYSVMHL